MSSRFLQWSKLASGRQSSEDRAEVLECGDHLVVVVADGAGGLRGGAAASAALVDAAREVARSSTPVHDADTWLGLLRTVDSTLAARRIGETTGVVVVIGPGGLTGVSVGDSEAWAITSSSIDDLTRSQERPRLGSGRASPVAFRRPKLDGVLLVGTDGLFKYASAARIAATVRQGAASRAVEALIALVMLPSGGFQDDVGIAVVAPR